jgi:EpsG family
VSAAILVAILAGAVGAVVLGILFPAGFAEHVYRRNFALSLVGVLLLVYVILAYLLPPAPIWDISRHYHELDQLRAASEAYGGEPGRYASLPGASWLFRLVSATPYNGLLVVAAVTASGAALVSPLVMLYRGQTLVRARELAIIVGLFLAYSNVEFTVSGVRNSIAVAFFCLGYSLEVGQNPRRLLAWVFYFSGISFHPAAAVLIVIRVLAFLPVWWMRLPAAALLLVVVGDANVRVAQASGNSYIRDAGDQMSAYLGTSVGVDMRILAINALIVLILLVWRLSQTLSAEEAAPYRLDLVHRFETTLFSFMLGSAVLLPIMFNRTLYAFGYVLIPLVVHLIRSEKPNPIVIVALWAGIGIGIIYQVVDFRFAYFLQGGGA